MVRAGVRLDRCRIVIFFLFFFGFFVWFLLCSSVLLLCRFSLVSSPLFPPLPLYLSDVVACATRACVCLCACARVT